MYLYVFYSEINRLLYTDTRGALVPFKILCSTCLRLRGAVSCYRHCLKKMFQILHSTPEGDPEIIEQFRGFCRV